MKPHSHEEHKRHTFDSFCKKVLKNEARDYYDELKRQREHEVFFSELSAQEMEMLFVLDDYSTNYFKVKLKLDKNNKATYKLPGGVAEIQLEDGPTIQVTSRYTKINSDGTKQKVAAPTTINIEFVPYAQTSENLAAEQAEIMSPSYTDWTYKGYYSIIDRPQYNVSGRGDYLYQQLAMEVDKYEYIDGFSMAYAFIETRNFYDRSTTKITAFDLHIVSSQFGQTITDGVPLGFSYNPDENDPGSQVDYITFGTTYIRNTTSAGYSAYSGWTPVSIAASDSFNLKHYNRFNYSFEGRYIGTIDSTDCMLAVKA